MAGSTSAGAATAAALTKSIRAQIDTQLDVWRVRTQGLGASRTYPLQQSGQVNPTTGHATVGADDVLIKQIELAVQNAVGPALEAAFSAEQRRRRDADDAVQQLTAAVLELRRESLRVADSISQLRNQQADAVISTRALQEEVTHLRRRVGELERDRETSAGRSADGFGATNGGTGGAGVRLSVPELLVLMNTAVGNSADGMQRLAPTPTAAGLSSSAVESIHAVTAVLRQDIAMLRDEMSVVRADVQHAMRREAAPVPTSKRASDEQQIKRSASASLFKDPVAPAPRHETVARRDLEQFVVRDESLHDIVTGFAETSAVLDVAGDENAARPAANTAASSWPALQSSHAVTSQRPAATATRGLGPADRYVGFADDDDPTLGTNNPFDDSERMDDGSAAPDRSAVYQHHQSILSHASGGISLSVYEAALARGSRDDVSALRQIEDLLDEENEQRSRNISDEFVARDALRYALTCSASEAAALTRMRVADDMSRNARALHAARASTEPPVAEYAMPSVTADRDRVPSGDQSSVVDGDEDPTGESSTVLTGEAAGGALQQLEPPLSTRPADCDWEHKDQTPLSTDVTSSPEISTATQAPLAPVPAAASSAAVASPQRGVPSVVGGASMRPPESESSDADEGDETTSDDIELPGEEEAPPQRRPIAQRVGADGFASFNDSSSASSSGAPPAAPAKGSDDPLGGFHDVGTLPMHDEPIATSASVAPKSHAVVASKSTADDGWGTSSDDANPPPPAVAAMAASRREPTTTSTSTNAGKTMMNNNRLRFSGDSSIFTAAPKKQSLEDSSEDEDAPPAAFSVSAVTRRRPLSATRGKAQLSAIARPPESLPSVGNRPEASSGDEW